MPRKRNVPERDELADMLDEISVPMLTEAEIAPLTEAMDYGAEEFQKASAALYQRMLVEGFKTIAAPRNLKELATVHKLFREAAGLDKTKDQGVVPQGFVPNMRTVSRRTIEATPPIIDQPAIDPLVIDMPGDLDDFEV
jgi:hypothetical protein